MNYRVPLQLGMVMAAVISLSHSADGSDPWSSRWLRGLTSGLDKRVTVFDRMGRYFGKRSSTELEDAFNSKPRPLYTVNDMEDLVSSSPRLLAGLIRGYIDQNGDGLIDESELSELKGRVMDL